METGLENPHVIYIPVSPGFPDKGYMESVSLQVREGTIDAVVIETYMSGGVTSIEPYGEIGFIAALSRRVPTFLVPQASRQQKYPRRMDGPERIGDGIPLETAYSGIADQVVAKIIEACRRNRNPQAVIAEVSEHFRQKEWPPPQEVAPQ